MAKSKNKFNSNQISNNKVSKTIHSKDLKSSSIKLNNAIHEKEGNKEPRNSSEDSKIKKINKTL